MLRLRVHKNSCVVGGNKFLRYFNVLTVVGGHNCKLSNANMHLMSFLLISSKEP